MLKAFGGHSMVAPLRRVAVKRPEDAWTKDTLARDWQRYGFTGVPDIPRATEEHEALVRVLEDAGAEVLYLPADDATTIDSIYAHDPALATDAGLITLRTGKENRRTEGRALARAAAGWGVPVAGALGEPAAAEGGDIVWLDPQTLVVGRGFRTNQAGIEALRSLVDADVIGVDLPYAGGPEECLHLMSVVSLVDDDLAVVYRPLMPVALYELLVGRGFALVDVPEDEYGTLGCNVLALGPRDVLIAKSNPKTAERLRNAGCVVRELEASEIGVKGGGGPTCLTRPLWRSV